MKKQALLAAAALLMIGAAGCSTVPEATEQPVVSSNEIPATVESTSSDMSTSVSDPVGGSAPVADQAPAPSSLGASSSGRGH